MQLLQSVVLLFVILEHTTVYGENIEPLILCDNRTESSGSSGIIQHIQRSESSSCAVVLEGFNINSYLSLLGLAEPIPSDIVRYPLVINGVIFAVVRVYNGTIIQLTDTKLSISLSDSRAPNFTLHYFTEVVVCGENIRIADGAQVDGLTGIISSSYDPKYFTQLSECTTTITNLPSGAVRIEFLQPPRYMMRGSVKVNYGAEFAQLSDRPIIVTTGTRQISITYTPVIEYNTPLHTSFVISYTVVTCGDFPEKSETVARPPATPWFPGSEVKYTCSLNNYTINGISTTQCNFDADRQVVEWTNVSSIKCTPVECETPNVTNGLVLYGGDTGRHYYLDALDYGCSLGYRKSVEENTTCQSDGLWSDTISCTRVECATPDIINGLVLSGGDTGRHYYLDTLDYECSSGYRKAMEKVVTCEIDGLWSDTVSCGGETVVALSGIITVLFIALIILIAGIIVRQWKVRARITSMIIDKVQKDEARLSKNDVNYDIESADLCNPQISREMPVVDQSHDVNIAQDSGLFEDASQKNSDYKQPNPTDGSEKHVYPDSGPFEDGSQKNSEYKQANSADWNENHVYPGQSN